jgi:hypothetical protein
VKAPGRDVRTGVHNGSLVWFARHRPKGLGQGARQPRGRPGREHRSGQGDGVGWKRVRKTGTVPWQRGAITTKRGSVQRTRVDSHRSSPSGALGWGRAY